MANQIELIKVSELEPYAKNSRTHSDVQIKGVMRSIEEFGFNNPILVKGRTILAGHCRTEAAKRLGLSEVPCINLEHLTPQQARAYVIADNKHALNAGWDDKILAEELQSLLDEEFDLSLTGFDHSELDELGVGSIDDLEGDSEKEDEVPEVEQNIHGVKRGDVWLMGDVHLECDKCGHRVEVDAAKDGDTCPQCAA